MSQKTPQETNEKKIFFIYYFTAPWSTLGHCWEGSLTNSMLITVFDTYLNRRSARVWQRGWIPKSGHAPSWVWTEIILIQDPSDSGEKTQLVQKLFFIITVIILRKQKHYRQYISTKQKKKATLLGMNNMHLLTTVNITLRFLPPEKKNFSSQTAPKI